MGLRRTGLAFDARRSDWAAIVPASGLARCLGGAGVRFLTGSAGPRASKSVIAWAAHLRRLVSAGKSQKSSPQCWDLVDSKVDTKYDIDMMAIVGVLPFR